MNLHWNADLTVGFHNRVNKRRGVIGSAWRCALPTMAIDPRGSERPLIRQQILKEGAEGSCRMGDLDF